MIDDEDEFTIQDEETFKPIKLFETPSFGAEQKHLFSPDKHSIAEDSTKSTSHQKSVFFSRREITLNQILKSNREQKPRIPKLNFKTLKPYYDKNNVKIYENVDEPIGSVMMTKFINFLFQ